MGTRTLILDTAVDWCVNSFHEIISNMTNVITVPTYRLKPENIYIIKHLI